MSATAAMEVCFLSGATLAALAPDEFEGKTAKAVKQALAVQIGVIRFKQRLFSEDGSEIPDDEVFSSAPVKLQMVVLDFYPADAQQSQQVISASMENDLIALEKFLNSPSNPNVTDEHATRHCTMLPVKDMLKACCFCLRQLLKKTNQEITG